MSLGGTAFTLTATDGVLAKELDLDGNRRIDNLVVDMGAYQISPFSATDVRNAL